MSYIIKATHENFENEILKSPIPVLIDFWSPHCAPCLIIAPFIEELAQKYDNRIKFAKVNVDEENILMEQHSIITIPVLVAYKNGKIVHKAIGAMKKQSIEKLAEDLL